MYKKDKIIHRILIAAALLIGISFSFVACTPDVPDDPPTEYYDD